MIVQHKFVEFMPDIIEDGVLYISLDYGTVIHNCACGCGSEVNTPLSPTGWKMIYNGEAITLNPSVGNWSFDCKSHYWIVDGRIDWASTWSDDKIRKKRSIESFEREMYYFDKSSKGLNKAEDKVEPIKVTKFIKKSWFQRIMFWK